MNTIVILAMVIAAFVWGFLEGREQPSPKGLARAEEVIKSEVEKMTSEALRDIGKRAADTHKEEIYVRYLFSLYVQQQILELPNFNGTETEALRLAVKIVSEYYNEHREEFDGEFDEAMMEVTEDIIDGKIGSTSNN